MQTQSASQVDIAAVTSLLQWKSKSKSDRHADESSSIALAQQLLADEATVAAIERTLHISRTRVLQTMLEYAVFLATKGDSSPSTSAHSFLFLSKAMLQTTSYQLSLLSCTQLLQAMSRVLAEHAAACRINSSSFDDALIDSLSAVFVRLFEAASTVTFVPRFGNFKPPTDVYATFFHSTLTSLLALAAAAPSPTIASFGLAILKTHHALQTNQTNKKKVFVACKQSLATLVTLRASTAALLPYSAGMLQALDASIADALFDPEHLHGYGGLVVATTTYPSPPTAPVTDEDASAPAKKKAKGSGDGRRNGGATSQLQQSYQHGLFDEIGRLVAVASHVAPFMQMLVREYVVYIRRSSATFVDKKKMGGVPQKRKTGASSSSKADAITPAFSFWLDMCAVTTTYLQQTCTATTTRQQQLANGSALWHGLWDVMNASDIYRVAEDNAGQHQLYYLEQTVASVMQHLESGATAATDTTLLSNMVQCSPKILQPHLALVFSYLATHATSSDDNGATRAAACLARLVESYDAMRLLEEFLAVLFQGDAASRHILCSLFVHEEGIHLGAAIRGAFANVPAGQVESLWLFFHDALYQSMHAKATTTVVNDGQLGLVRTVFALYMQEVPATEHIQPALLQCAKQTFDLVLLPRAIPTPSPSSSSSLSPTNQLLLQREALSLLGELGALTDKGVDMSFVGPAVFDTPVMGVFTAAIPSMFGNHDHPSDHEGGILKLCATRVRQLVSTFRPSAAEPIASFVLGQAVARLDHVAIVTPFLNELGHAATAASCTEFVNAISRAAVNHTLRPNLFLDAGFYEIRPFLSVLPAAFTSILTRRTLAAMWTKHPPPSLSKKKGGSNSKAAAASSTPTPPSTLPELRALLEKQRHTPTDEASLLALHAAVEFMMTVPLPNESGLSSEGAALFGCILDVEALLTSLSTNAEALVESLHEWLQSLLAGVVAPLAPPALTLLTTWTSALLARDASLQSNLKLWKPIIRVLVHFHPKHMAPIHDAVVASATSSKTATMDVVALCLEAWGGSNHAAMGDRFFQALLPALLARFEHPTPDDAHVLAAAVQYCHRAKGGRVPPSLLPFVGPFLAVACRTIVQDQQLGRRVVVSSRSSSARLVHIVCAHVQTLALDLATVGRLVATLLVGGGHSLDDGLSSTSLELLVENATPDEFHLVWRTLTSEIAVLHDPARVLAALRAMLKVLCMERAPKNQRVLADSAKTTLATLVNLCNDDDAASHVVTEIHVAALRVVAQAFAKGGDAFDWHAADIHVALLALRPLLSVVASPSSPRPSAGLGPQVWQQSYLLLLRLLRQYHTTLPQYLPHFVAGCNALLRALLYAAAKADSTDHNLLHLWASNLTRLYGYMLPHATSFRKHMVYMLSEFFYKHDALPVDVQGTLRPGIYALFDICSKYEKEQLYGTLDGTGKVLLKAIDAHYKESHQYTGKV
ncbi:hypothetical protein DYB30_000874 [Aphanomyces astaci]|uniref:Nucleolar 27S pre-rRNA processing Urb2/Npa2 C-terminal domain-containing protein n=2 Tax=Aphanomyces astaci TaxID=112090 RepID=A0A397DF11_APHAT|nr:hypothetical protein DYB30_000874 [Aphanomyces astaci]RHZ32751.1 hypothetical protein DYB26_000858 [Aphanomyces astaci]